jgi:IclR helix-turn-helix domain
VAGAPRPVRRGAAARARAPRGANRAAVLGVIGERPGVSARELAAASGVGRGTLYALLRTLTQRGEIETQQLPSGHTGYTLAATATTAAPPPAPSTQPDIPSDSATTPAPAASRQDHHTTATPTASDDVTAAAPSSEKRPDDATDTE